LRFPTGKLRAAGAGAEAEQLRLQDDFLCRFLHREIAGDIEGVVAGFLPRLALERNGRELLGEKEVSAAEVSVALLFARVDARDLDGGFDLAVFEVVAVDAD